MMNRNSNLFHRFPLSSAGSGSDTLMDTLQQTGGITRTIPVQSYLWGRAACVIASRDIEQNVTQHQESRAGSPGHTIARNPGQHARPVHHHPSAATTATTVATHRIYPHGTATANVPLASYFEVGTPTLRCGAYPSRPGGSFPEHLLSTRMRQHLNRANSRPPITGRHWIYRVTGHAGILRL